MVSLLKMHSVEISWITDVDCFQARAQIDQVEDFEVPSKLFQ